jgi:hypothetical protein
MSRHSAHQDGDDCTIPASSLFAAIAHLWSCSPRHGGLTGSGALLETLLDHNVMFAIMAVFPAWRSRTCPSHGAASCFDRIRR